jgi:hypothetical protein
MDDEKILETLRLQAIERAMALDPEFKARVEADRLEQKKLEDRTAALEARKHTKADPSPEEAQWVSLQQQIQNRSRCDDDEIREAKK